MIYGSILVALVVWPILMTNVVQSLWPSIGRESSAVSAMVNFLHPFLVEVEILDGARRSGDVINTGWLTTLLNIAFAILLLVWAEFTLRFAEMDVGFIPRRNRASDR